MIVNSTITTLAGSSSGGQVPVLPEPKRPYWHNFWIGFDQWCNTIAWGMPGETLSTRAGRLKNVPGAYGWRVLAWSLDTVFPGHTAAARLHDAQRAERIETTEATGV
jgi:hypothetical protein